jgi:hypothetical protein
VRDLVVGHEDIIFRFIGLRVVDGVQSSARAEARASGSGPVVGSVEGFDAAEEAEVLSARFADDVIAPIPEADQLLASGVWTNLDFDATGQTIRDRGSVWRRLCGLDTLLCLVSFVQLVSQDLAVVLWFQEGSDPASRPNDTGFESVLKPRSNTSRAGQVVRAVSRVPGQRFRVVDVGLEVLAACRAFPVVRLVRHRAVEQVLSSHVEGTSGVLVGFWWVECGKRRSGVTKDCVLRVLGLVSPEMGRMMLIFMRFPFA